MTQDQGNDTRRTTRPAWRRLGTVTGTLVLVAALLSVYAPATAAQSGGAGYELPGILDLQEEAAANVVCRHDEPIRSDGNHGDIGLLWSCNVGGGNSNGIYQISYRYCYVARTNGRPAGVTTYFETFGNVLVPEDQHTFRNPHTGDGSCEAGELHTYGFHSFTAAGAAVDRVRFDYQNGDWKISVGSIVVTRIA